MSELATRPEATQETAADRTSALPNKYVYSEFAGWSGERYLKKLLRQVLPLALYRTWEIFVDHQAIGNECYLGMGQLAEIAQRTMRTMEKNVAELSAKQLLVERAERKVFRGPNGSLKSKVVVVKDFSGLYALAHEYHEWLYADNYIAPKREVVELVMQSPGLEAKLRRFDNYRRVFNNRLPGPPPRAREEDRWFTEYRDEKYFAITEMARVKKVEKQETDVIPKEYLAIELAKGVAEDPRERINECIYHNSLERDSFDSASSFSQKLLKQEEARPPRAQRRDKGNRENAIPGERSRESTRSNESATCVPSSPSLQNNCPDRSTSKQGCAETHTEGRSAGQALATGDIGQTGRSLHSRAESGCPHPPLDLLARSFVHEISAPFGDRNTKGSMTRVLSIIADSRLEQPAEVLLCLIRAYTIARKTRKVRPEHWNPETERANRMPLFFTMFQRFVQARVQGSRWQYTWQQMEEDIAADDLLALWWSEYQTLIRETPGNDIHEQEDGQNFPDGRQETELCAADAQARYKRSTRLSQTEVEREERATFARKVLTRLLRMAVPIQGAIILWEHVPCGCPLYHKRNGKEVCALCFPDLTWSKEVLTLIHSIVEAKTVAGFSNEATERAHGQVPGGTRTESDGDQPRTSEAEGWAEREEAYAHGTRLLEAMAMNGYLAEVRLRLVDSRYRIVLVGEGYELVCEVPEQVEYLIAQAQNGTV